MCSGVAATFTAASSSRLVAEPLQVPVLLPVPLHPLRIPGAVGVADEANRQPGGEPRRDSDAAPRVAERGAEERSPLRGCPSWPSACSGGGAKLDRLLKLTLPGVDGRALGRELLEESWSEQTLLVKVLRQFGARDLVVASRADGSKDMTFSLSNLGIPWEKVAYVLGRQAVQQEVAQGGLAEWVSHATVEELPDEGVVADVEFVLDRLGLSMSFRIALRGNAFDFDAGVRKLDKGGILDNAIVWRFMRAGFMGAAKRFGQAVATELRLRARGGEGGRAAAAPLLESLML